MGCGASTVPVSDVNTPSKTQKAASSGPTGARSTVAHGSNGSNRTESNFYVQTMNYQSPLIRLDHSSEPRLVSVKGNTYDLDLKYVYVSQRGFYPSDPSKANQDSYIICESLLGDHSCNMFGIFDGHGTYGDLCSFTAASDQPKNLVKALNKNGGLTALDGDRMNDVYTKSFVDTDKAMHANEKIDDSLSGTTGVTVLQKGDRLLVANVGDSRAIICSLVDGKLVASPLSDDQTPYRADERERLKKCGARIMTIDQIEGNEPMHENFGTQLGNEIDEGGDPPRVWDSTLEKPGCAFSRSIGDNVAKKVGVCAEPEILVWDITPQDKFAVVASDGVFEFITSQNVAEMLSKFEDPIEGAKHVVAEAYRLWLTFDDRTDDITIIVVHFDNIKLNNNDHSTGGHTTTVTAGGRMNRAMSISKGMIAAEGPKESRPVRKVMSKAKRAEITENFDAIGEDTESAMRFDFDSVVDNKSEADKARISKMLSTNFMFQNLTTIQKEKVIRVMSAREVKVDELIIKEGDKGDEMYIIDSGEFIVRKIDEKGVDQVVFVYTVEGSAFGELSLMYGKPRAASIIAKTNGKLWTIGRAAFKAVIMLGKQEHDGLLDVFKSIPVFKDCPIPTLQRLSTSCVEVQYEKGDIIMHEDEPNRNTWCFCVIITGVIRLIAKEEGKKRQLRAELSYLSVHEIGGSRFSEARADSKLKLTCIPKDVCMSVLGADGMAKLKNEMERSKLKGKRLNMDKNMFENPDNLTLQRIPDTSRFALQHPMLMLGQFAYIGQFKDVSSGKFCSIKVIAKRPAVQLRMDHRMLQERNLLVAINRDCPGDLMAAQEAWLPIPLACMQDSRRVYLIYQDLYACDLAVALSSGAIDATDKPFFVASIFSAMRAIHRFGLLHRYINANSIYVTSGGIPKICDFRFAKQMKGSPSFTICGDPLFFSPEIVNSQGYDYAADLWAFGVLFYEFFEEVTPFGDSHTDETTIFKKISAFKDGTDLTFSDKTPESARSLLQQILNPIPGKRLGYILNDTTLEKSPYFTGIDWAKLPDRKGKYCDVQPQIELGDLFDDAHLQPVENSNIFSQY